MLSNYKYVSKILLTLLGLLATSGHAGDLLQIHNFHVVSSSLATAGTLEKADISVLAEQGFEVIIDLRYLQDGDLEPEIVVQSGMAYVNIPVSSKNPEYAVLADFLQAMQENGHKKVLVHCRSNKRASAMTFLYQVIEQGEDAGVAWQHVLAIGEPSETWQLYIDRALTEHTE